MSIYYKVKIDSGTAAGPYTIYHTQINSSNIATLYSNAQPAVNVTYTSLNLGDGVLIIVPDNATRIILYNQDCDTYEDNLVTYNISAASSNVNEGSSITLNVTTRNVPDNTTLYWTINYNNSSSDPDFFTAVTGTTTINNRVSTFSVTMESDLATEGSETFYVELRTGSVTGTIVDSTDVITINDTSRYYYYLVKDTYNCEAYGNATAYYKVNSDYGNNKLVKVNGQGDNKWLERNESQQNDGTSVAFVDVTNCVKGTPTYSITESTNTINEGGTVTFAINTTYVQDGTRLYWKINYNNNSSESSDFSLTDGTFVISNGSGSVSTTIVNDISTDGTETFYAELREGSTNGRLLASSGVITINDTSTSPPTYSLSTPSSVNEGSTANFNVTTTDVPNGTILYWRVNFNDISDIDDFSSITGTTTINNNSSTIGVGIVNDNKTEGLESFKLELKTDNLRNSTPVATSGVVTINDTSTYPAVILSITQSCLGTSGSSGRLTFTNVTGGNNGPYQVTLNGTDWTTWSSNYRIDGIADGTYNNVQARDSYGNYSSKTSVTFDCYRAPTYSLSTNVTTVNEPGSITCTATTQYVSNGTILYWTTEYDSSDFISTDFVFSTGTVTINNNTGTFNIGIRADQITEGTETFKVRLRTNNTSGTVVATSGTITINDTSVNTVPNWESQNYTTCSNCQNISVYKDTNPNSITNGYYRIGESGTIQQGQPSGAQCNYDPNYTESFGCNGCTRYKVLTKTNPCSNDESPKTQIISLNSADCYQSGVNCCGQVTTPNFVFEGSYGCSGCAKYEILVDRNVCTSGQYGSTQNGSVVNGNSADCHQPGDCCGQPTIAVYNNIILVECNGGIEYKLVEDSNPCSPTYGPDYRIYIPTGGGACYTSYGSFATSCDDAFSSTGLVNIYTNGTTYRIGGDNGSLVDGSYYSMSYVDNDGGSDYRYSPRRHVFVNGELNTLDLNGCRLYDNTGQIG